MVRIQIKSIIIPLLMVLLVLAGHKTKIEYNNYVDEKNMSRLSTELKEKGWDAETLYKKENNRIIFTEKIKENANKEIDRLSKQLQTDEYKEMIYVNKLKKRYGIKSSNYQIYTMTLSFYTDLNCENGFGPITATGKRLSTGQIANNQLPFGTKVYIDGYGMKTVEDRGSRKYFNSVTKVDVFIPRNAGESDSSYFRRVNNMGKVKTKAIVFN